MGGKREKSDSQKVLDAVSTLKRVAGIPNSPGKQDEQPKSIPGFFEVHIPDYESGVILANLISQSILKSSGHTEKYWSNKNRWWGLQDQVKLIQDGDDTCRIVFQVPLHITKRVAECLNDTAQNLIMPDKKPGHSR
jgi:hypothetical protein